MKHDAFISHASEDKSSLVAPLAKLLDQLGANIWYDDFSLELGDSLSRSIDKGLSQSRYGVLVLSPSFFAKPWPEYELRGLVSKEMGGEKVIIPIWHNVNRDDVLKYSPPLADKKAIHTKNLTITEIALSLLKVICPDVYASWHRRALLVKAMNEAPRNIIPVTQLEPGPIRHNSLPKSLLLRIRLIQWIMRDVIPIPLDETINSFRRDDDPSREIIAWELICGGYVAALQNAETNTAPEKDIANFMLERTCGPITPFNHKLYPSLSDKQVEVLMEIYRELAPKEFEFIE
jgi:hypothetical protein